MERQTATYMQIFPVRADVGTTITGGVYVQLPWGALAFYGQTGTTAAGEPMLTIGQEWPMSWLRTVEPLHKFDREFLCLRRFSSDQAVATGGQHAFADIQRGDDPPDATVLTDAGRIGAECFALTIQERRVVYDLFGQLRRRLQADDATRFAKLAGHMVLVWFQEGSSPGPPNWPHKRTDAQAFDLLVDALAEYEPTPESLRQDGTSAPPVMPQIPLAGTPMGASFYTLPLLGGVPGSMLYTLAGFDIGLVYSTVLTAAGLWGEVQRLVDGHDQPGVDLLLVTAGAPDEHGNVFPAESAVADFLLEHAIGLSHRPKHIKKVILHSWATGRATTLFPDLAPLFGPLYTTMTPLHHAFAVMAQSEDGNSESDDDPTSAGG